MIIIDNIEQGTPEWFALRAGVPSASCFSKIVTSTGKRSKSRNDYMYQLAGEMVLGEKQEGYSNAAMERGVELEPDARKMYELINCVQVQQVGLCYRDEDKRFSCSPDGLVGDDGGLEIKCPALHTHVEYCIKGKLPTKYYAQVQGSLFITGRKWWDFVSYFPGMKLFQIRVTPDIDFHAALESELGAFCDDLAGVVGKLTR